MAKHSGRDGPGFVSTESRRRLVPDSAAPRVRMLACYELRGKGREAPISTDYAICERNRK